MLSGGGALLSEVFSLHNGEGVVDKTSRIDVGSEGTVDGHTENVLLLCDDCIAVLTTEIRELL